MRGLAGIAGAAMGVALASQGRIYGAENIARHIQKHGRSRQIGNSIADQPHEHKREIARRKRQAERNAERRDDRVARAWSKPPAGFGLSRRGRVVAL